MRDLRKGPEYFYNQKDRKAKIEAVLKKREDLKEEIEMMKKEIEEKKNEEGLLENTAAFYKEVAEQFCQELKNMIENKPQGKQGLSLDGVIEEDILENFKPEEARKKEVVEKFLKQFKFLDRRLMNEAFIVETEITEY